MGGSTASAAKAPWLQEVAPRRAHLRPQALWSLLTRPSSAVLRADDRARATFVASFLLVGSALSVTAHTFEGPARAYLITHLLVDVALIGSYALSRSRHWRAAWAGGLGVVVLGSLGMATLAPTGQQVFGALMCSTLGVAMAGAFTNTRITAALALVITAAALAVGGTHPALDAASWGILTRVLPLFSGVLVAVTGMSGQALRELGQRSAMLAECEQRYALAARGANDALWDWNLRDGSAYFSPRWDDMVGGATDGATLENWLGRVHEDQAQRLRKDLANHVAGLTPHFENTHQCRHADGGWRWLLARGLAVRDDSGRVVRVAGSITDVTDQKRFEEQLLHGAFHDPLTGLPNRALFLDRLGHAVNRSQRRAEHLFGVLFLDLDRFKVINDSLGHRVGDELLRGIARRVEECVRPGDTVARLGGDEFTVLLDDLVRPNDAELVAGRIQEALKTPFRLDGHEVVTSASIGIALSLQGYNSAEDIVRDADTAMYRAKADGKARHRVFDQVMHHNAVERLTMESELRRAVDRQEFELHYQPVVSLQSGQIEGFEALVRWNHPTRGLVSPAEFIPIAEETGLINPLGWWVLREAATQARDWQQKYPRDLPLQMNVNLSGRQFRQPDLIRGVVTILNDIGLEPDTLRLEITESVLMETAADSRSVLAELREHGIRLCIDDFGTGYSSLNYLHSFDIDVLKIDRSFVSRIREGRAPEIVQTIVDLSRSLGLAVTAEGIETAEQLRQLRAMDVELGQGFYFARGLSASRADRLLKRNPTW